MSFPEILTPGLKKLRALSPAILIVLVNACGGGSGSSDESYPDIDMRGAWKGNFTGPAFLIGTISNDLDIEITSQKRAEFSGRWKLSTDSDWSSHTVTGYLEPSAFGDRLFLELGTGLFTDCVSFSAENNSYFLYSSVDDPDNFSDLSASHNVGSSCYKSRGKMTISRL